MKSQLKEIISNLDPFLFGVNKIKITSFKKLGLGESNINYVFVVCGKKYLCRFTLDGDKSNKIEDEFNNLKIIESYDLSPKPLFFRKKDSLFDRNISILAFIEGTPFRQGQKTFSNKQIKLLANSVSTLHTHKPLKLKKLASNAYIEVFNWAKLFERDINKYSNNRFKEVLSIINQRIKLSISLTSHPYSISHNDICPQNVVEQKNKIKFIDWEAVSLSDPARDVANIIDDFGLKGNQLDLFLKEYFLIRKDTSLMKRVQTHILLKRNNYFFWELRRVFEILNGELPSEYLAKTSVHSHIKESKSQFKKMKQLIDLPDLDIDSIFKDYL